MTKVRNYMLLKLWSLIRPLSIKMDGNDNTVTVNHSLYDMLMFLGITQNNHIYSFKLRHEHGYDYCFCLLPEDMKPEDTITSELKYNDHFKIFGFEMLCPTVQHIFYVWGMDPHRILKKRIRITRIKQTGLIVFIIKK